MADEIQQIPSSERAPLPSKESTGDSNAFEAGAKMQLKPVGGSGTELFAGYFTEEYLQALRGKRGAKVFDEIRRSESQVSMLMNAVMNPIKAGTWEFEDASNVANSTLHKELVEYCLKEMIDFETFLHEALTFLIFGFSLFETVNNVVFNHPKFGTFNGLKGIAFRSPKTIERWNVERSGDLKSVTQWLQGDVTAGENGAPQGGLSSQVDMPAQHLLIFTLNKEGDNYEGISALRPMYGPWFRKNLYLKIAGIGIEKNAIGTPLGTQPAGKENAQQLEAFKEMLSNFTAHEAAYLIKPAGWEVEILQTDFDAAGVKEMILLENTEMINCLVANFLALGMNGGGGAFALGSDLSDFFLSGIQTYANIICGVINRKLIPSLVKLNYGPQQSYPKIKATGISDKAGKELAEILSTLLTGKALTADTKLEDFLRKQYNLPKADPTTSREQAPPAPMQFTEQRIQLAETYKAQWKTDKDKVKEVMQTGLEEMLEGYKAQIKRLYNKATDAGKQSIALQLEPKTTNYTRALQEMLAEIANRALIGAKKETPKAKNVKLSERIQLAAPKGGYFDALPANIKRIVRTQASLIANTQSADLEKVVTFQYSSSQASTENIEQILLDIDDAALPVIEGSTAKGISVDAAAGNAVSSIANQARLEWFFEPEVLETIESFTFYNEDPVSEICQELDGMTWAVNDPDLDRYSPPLHHNCKSRLMPNEKGADKNPEIQRGGTPVTEKGLKSITLCEEHYHLPVIKLGGPGSGPRPGKGSAGKKSQGSKASKASEPTPEEAKAIRMYTGALSSQYIAADRGGAVDEMVAEQNKTLNAYLENAPKFEGNLHRGISVEAGDVDSVLSNYKPGAEISLDAKQSWTTDTKNVQARLTQVANEQKSPTPIVFEYPNSKVGVDVSAHSRFEEEKEVLVPKGAKYKVKSVEPHNGGYKVTFE